VACEILQYAALQLATLASSVRAQLWAKTAAVEVAYSGGVFKSADVAERFRQLVELEPQTECGPARHSAAEGALLEAYRIAGLNLDLA
jgi:N-acetylglucosamine kinase-like BadF-type ATPase